MRALLEKFAIDVAALQLGDQPSDRQLAVAGDLMLHLASATDWPATGLVPASGDQELLYPLHVTPAQPALYLVSDGPGVTSAPHGHATWAVIVGVHGNEHNTMYRRDTPTADAVRPVSNVDVKALDVLILRATAIHATRAADQAPTFHLHLYGKPLDELPPYASRCYST